MLIMTLANKLELVFGLFLWWLAVYLFTQNPFSRIIRIASALIASIAFYFSGIVFLSFGRIEPQYYSTIVRAFIWSMYLPMPLLYHATLSILPTQNIRKWQKYLLYFGYIMATILFLLELKTNLIRDYEFFSTAAFTGNLNEATGKLFWLSSILIVPMLIGIASNLSMLAKKYKKFSSDWQKYALPAIGSVISVLLSPLTVLGFYGIIFPANILSVLTFAVVVLPLIYSIVRYNLFLDELKIIFSRIFVYNTVVILAMSFVYVYILTRFDLRFVSIPSFGIFYILLHTIVLTHPLYNWLLTFSRDLLFNVSSGFSVVNDEEIGQALKDYNYPDKLEQNTLLRLNIVKNISRKSSITPVDALREVLKESVAYISSDDDKTKRTKQNLKYHSLKMFAFDEAEEGQILWELGFDDYPVRVMQLERKSRPPLFQQMSPSDYSYKSRNAYLALKKEAIHNIAWRLSYLEKCSNKKAI